MVRVAFDEIVRSTAKAILIRHTDHLCWLPLSQVVLDLDGKKVYVPKWLHINMDWQPDRMDIEYMPSEDEVAEVRAWLEGVRRELEEEPPPARKSVPAARTHTGLVRKKMVHPQVQDRES